MTPWKEIGECLISYRAEEYFFRPSFTAMSRIGTPEEIVEAFYALHNDEATPRLKALADNYQVIPEHQRRFYAAYSGSDMVPAFALKWLLSSACSKAAISAAMIVLAACCDRDTTPLTGELVPGKTGRRAFVYRPGVMSLRDMVLIAQSLIQHGIIGKAKVRKLQRHGGSSTSSEFNAFEYISAARTHLGMSREEAEQLTMTEFQMLLAANFPEQKGFTKEEYDAVADDYLTKKAKRLQASERK